MRVGIPVGTVVGAALLMVAGPLSAQAAVGDLVWSDDSPQAHAIIDPEDGSCITFKNDEDIPVNAVRIANHTDHKIEVYKEADCAGPGVFTLDHDGVYNEGAASVKIWATNEAPLTR